ncbi:MAG: hypothetical protein Q8O99_06650 [bacterium]|nr:hypothetical protein [bacterium]
MIAYLFTEETDSPIPVCGIDLQHTTPIFSTNKVNLQATIDGA